MEIFAVPTVFPYLAANDELYRFFIFQFFFFSKIQPSHFYNYNFPPRHQIRIIIFQSAITTTIAAGRQKDEFYSYIGRLRHGPNSTN